MSTDVHTIPLPRDICAASVARRTLEEKEAVLDLEGLADAKLLVSELVNNAVLHGEGAITLRVDVNAQTVRFTVEDEGKAQPQPRQPEDLLEGGWGLTLVSSMARDWGVAGPTTRVWFELSRVG